MHNQSVCSDWRRKQTAVRCPNGCRDARTQVMPDGRIICVRCVLSSGEMIEMVSCESEEQDD